MKRIIKETVKWIRHDFGSEIVYDEQERFIVQTSNVTPGGNVTWCDDTYITADFEEKPAIFYNYSEAVAFCKGKTGKLTMNLVATFDDDGSQMKLN